MDLCLGRRQNNDFLCKFGLIPDPPPCFAQGGFPGPKSPPCENGEQGHQAGILVIMKFATRIFHQKNTTPTPLPPQKKRWASPQSTVPPPQKKDSGDFAISPGCCITGGD